MVDDIVTSELEQHLETVTAVIKLLKADINTGCEIITNAILKGKKIFLAGNGGSAADAQHIAAEFTGRYVKERKPLPAIALHTDTSALTAISNDYGYDAAFARQLEAFAAAGDVFIGISTSGNSHSILNALQKAKDTGCITIGLSGRGGGKMNDLCDINIVIPADVTARIQEMHILVGHIFCGAVDALF